MNASYVRHIDGVLARAVALLFLLAALLCFVPASAWAQDTYDNNLSVSGSGVTARYVPGDNSPSDGKGNLISLTDLLVLLDPSLDEDDVLISTDPVVGFADPSVPSSYSPDDYVGIVSGTPLVSGKLQLVGATRDVDNTAVDLTVEVQIDYRLASDPSTPRNSTFTVVIDPCTIKQQASAPAITYGANFADEINDNTSDYFEFDNGQDSSELADLFPDGEMVGFDAAYEAADVYPAAGANLDIGTQLAVLELDDDYKNNYDLDITGSVAQLDAMQEFSSNDYSFDGDVYTDADDNIWFRAGGSTTVQVNDPNRIYAGTTAPTFHFDGTPKETWPNEESITAESTTVYFRNDETQQIYDAVTLTLNEDEQAPAVDNSDPDAAVVAESGAVIDQLTQTDGTVTLFMDPDGTISVKLHDYKDSAKTDGCGVDSGSATFFYDGNPIDGSITIGSSAAEAVATFTLPASDEPYDTSLITIEMGDNVGNMADGANALNVGDYFTRDGQDIARVVVVNAVPEVSVSFDNNDVRNSMYYKAARTATIAIDYPYFSILQDTSSKSGDTVVTLTATDAAGATTTTTKTIADFADRGDGVYVLDVPCIPDALYQMNVSLNYLADRTADPSPQPDDFIVDTTKPTFDGVSWANPVNTFLNYNVYASSFAEMLHYVLNDTGVQCGLNDWKITYGGVIVAQGTSSPRSVDTQVQLPADDRMVSTTDIIVEGHDFAGNALDSTSIDQWLVAHGSSALAPSGFVVDSADPVLTLTYDNNKDYVPGYFDAPRTATFTLVEASFGNARNANPDAPVATRTFQGDATHYAAFDFTNPSGDNLTWVLNVPCPDDGNYTFTADWVDIALKDSGTITDAFTVDTVNPIIDVTWDNNDVRNDKYFKAVRTATITVTDVNITPDQFITVTSTAADASGASVAAPATGTWSQLSDTVWQTSVYYGDELHYTLDVTAIDKAGNAAVPYSSGEFIIDVTAPTVRIDNVEDTAAYAGVVAPTVFYEDTNFQESATTLSVAGASRGSVDFTNRSQTVTPTSKTLAYTDIDRVLVNDDIYTWEAGVTDLAGNESRVAKTFSINRFGSNYILSKPTNDIIGGYLNTSPEVVVTEINVSGLADNATMVRVAQNAQVRELSAADYRVEKNPNSVWSEYTYTIPASVFSQDAYYRVLLLSRDVAENVSENLMENKDADRTGAAYVNFAVDKTAPLAACLDVEPGTAYFAPGRSIQVRIGDNMGVVDASMTADGQTLASWNGQAVGKDAIETVDIAAKDTPQTLLVTVHDVAGNTTTTEVGNVIVTNNFLIYWFNTPRLFYGTLIPFLFAVALVTGLVIRHNLKKSAAPQ